MEQRTPFCPWITAGVVAKPTYGAGARVPCAGSACAMWRDKGAVFDGDGKGKVTGKGRCFKNALGAWFDDPAVKPEDGDEG